MKLYIEINLTCIFILCLIVYKILRDLNLRTAKKLFIFVLCSSMVFFALDVHLALIKMGVLQVSRTVNGFTYGFYEFQAVFVGYMWSLYILHMFDSNIMKNKLKLLLWTIPFIILGFLCFASIKTGWIFYIDEMNNYRKGSWYIIQLLMGYAYILWAAAETFYKILTEKNYVKRKEYFNLSSFIILPLITGFLQGITGGLPILCVGITMSYLIVFMSFQEGLISKDSFTGLNNKNELNKYLYSKMEQGSRKKDLYLIMIDIDSFKTINDDYGHVEGDNAILRFASVLKEICGLNNCFTARYGGDEFVVVCEYDTLYEFNKFQQEIIDKLNESNKVSDCSYTISISMGYALYNKNMQSIQKFIGAADSELYKVKRSKTSDSLKYFM